MRYSLQHNGKGKTHLINNDNNALCGIPDIGNFTPVLYLEVKNNNFYEVFERTDCHDLMSQISTSVVEYIYCKKCIKKALKDE